MKKLEISCLCQFAKRCKFMIETGSGQSTHYLSKIAKENNAIFYSIDINDQEPISGVIHKKGWSILYEDMENFYPDIESRYSKDCPDRLAFLAGKKYFDSFNTDLIRKCLFFHKTKELDFFFCDTGEYCGEAEWDIVKSLLSIGGIFACHDIFFPKSIKCYKIAGEILGNPDKWEVLKQINTKQGLLIARKIANV